MPDVRLFATPVFMYELPNMDEINRDITARLISEAHSEPSIKRSNVGGWHSRVDLHVRRESSFRTLIDRIVSSVRSCTQTLASDMGQPQPPTQCKPHAWAMVMRNGHYTLPHDHSEVHWATVYYADAGDADANQCPDSGLLGLVDPRHGGRPIPGLDLVGGTFYVQPKAGQLLIFPGWVLHYVNAYQGQRPRVSISCNVTLEVTGYSR